MVLPIPICCFSAGIKIQGQSPVHTMRQCLPRRDCCWNRQERKEILLFLFNRWETKAQRVEEACQKSDRNLKTARNRIQVC